MGLNFATIKFRALVSFFSRMLKLNNYATTYFRVSQRGIMYD